MMMKARRFAVLISLISVFLLIGCSSNKPTKSDRQPTAVAITLLKTTLAATIQKVTLEVVQNDQIIHRDTTTVADGHFSFSSFDLDAGVATFTVHALDSENHVVYSGQTTVTIEPGRDNTVSLQLLPATPMIKLSPYWWQTQTGSPFVSHLELYNIAKLRTGGFRVNFDPAIIRFDSIRSSSTAWGELADSASILRSSVLVSVWRHGNNDSTPANSPALVDLWFTALIAGTTDLTPTSLWMLDDQGTIAELADPSFVADGQTISIQGVTQYGTIAGSVNNALNGDAMDSVDITITGPAQRSTSTNSDGMFSMAELPYGSYQVIASKTGFINGTRTVQLLDPTVSIDFVLTPVLDSTQFRAVLTWGSEPRDLDLHLWTLNTEIYFGNKGTLDTIPYAMLDVDDLNGYGPETITIGKLLDTCKFSVYSYSGSPDITVSRAHIDFYKGSSLIRGFDIPTTGVGRWWYAFDLTPTGVIIERNTIIDYNPGGGQRSPQPTKSAP
jgi:uncharacterized protein YcfL